MDKFAIFKVMLDYLAHITTDVTEANLNYYPGCMKIGGNKDGQYIEITVTITGKEEKEDA